MKASSPQLRAASSNIDISIEGKQHGYITLPCSTELSEFGAAQIPVCVIRNGDGPVITLLAGSRGDEYDGRIAMHNLIANLAVEDISGCLIIVPTMNPLAAAKQCKYCPVDNKDLDASFPGDAAGSITEQIAAELLKHVIEPATLILEFQSGGATTEFTALAAIHFNADNNSLQQESEQSMIAFGAPFSARLLPSSKGSLAQAAQALEKRFIAIRLGGGASSNAHCISTALTGCKNVLVQLGVLKDDLELRSTRMLEVTSEKNYVLAPCNGLLEMCKEPGEDVYMGSPVARILSTGQTGAAPTILKADRNGILMARHHGGYVEQGQCVAIVADEVQR